MLGSAPRPEAPLPRSVPSTPTSRPSERMAQGMAMLHVSSFRPLQREAIVALLSGRDVLLVMATGAGKSLCFQLPAVVTKGVTVVISPLIALMRDQVNKLQELGIKCALLNSTLAASGRRAVMEDLEAKDPVTKLLYGVSVQPPIAFRVCSLFICALVVQ